MNGATRRERGWIAGVEFASLQPCSGLIGHPELQLPTHN
jgi:hypothetical protein